MNFGMIEHILNARSHVIRKILRLEFRRNCYLHNGQVLLMFINKAKDGIEIYMSQCKQYKLIQCVFK